MSFEARVPATLSNLGPGFDVLGLAVSIENTFHFEQLEDPEEFRSEGERVRPEDHVSFATIKRAEARFGRPLGCGLSLTQQEAIPRSRGLGSSAAARAAGLAAYRALSGASPSLQEAVDLLSEAEGHPDNAVPALVGGLTLCAEQEGSIRHLRLEPPKLEVALCIPTATIETAHARKVMPSEYRREDVVFNLSRLAFLLVGLSTGNWDALALGCEDRVHEPYRRPLIGPADEALAAAKKTGATAAFVSGSGSTLAAFVTNPSIDPAEVAQAMASVFVSRGLEAESLVTRPRTSGAWAE